ncbi:CAMK family protein kinase [Tritrichomonas foetus]|uniref:CAMK family protein kinase n=1 Tax=Tritrichomonas foetus TaxID=1144522 RepID=A0A1J4L1G6_9EUKA|nr:CAMK family protein kinase [Tritrichomonas foetus]|eukprot:OHT17258.1 CAMK family protein kinase [Tritrichomonas foetus]
MMVQKIQRVRNYRIIDQCGEGSTSCVFKAVHTTLKLPVAMKTIKKAELTEKQIISLKREIELMRDINFPNIITFYESFEDDENMYLSLEFAEKGSLADMIRSTNYPFSNEQIRAILFQVASALKYLHCEKKIIHRDLKPENILFDINDKVKLADFGLSTRLGSYCCTRCGSPIYASPEMIKGDKYSAKTDIWSFGILSFLLATLKFPFYDETNNIQSLYQKIVNHEVIIPSNIDPLLSDLIVGCLCKDAFYRFDIDQVLEHPFFGYNPITPPLYRSKFYSNMAEIYKYMENIGYSKEKVQALMEEKDENMSIMLKILMNCIGTTIKKSFSTKIRTLPIMTKQLIPNAYSIKCDRRCVLWAKIQRRDSK